MISLTQIIYLLRQTQKPRPLYGSKLADNQNSEKAENDPQTLMPFYSGIFYYLDQKLIGLIYTRIGKKEKSDKICIRDSSQLMITFDLPFSWRILTACFIFSKPTTA